MKKVIVLMVIGFFSFGSSALFAAETKTETGTDVKKPSAIKTILNVQERGIVSGVNSPREFVRTFKTEKKLHPKAWPLTYLPKASTNFIVRLTSGVNDVVVMPWLANFSGDSRPMTRQFDLPDYPWQTE